MVQKEQRARRGRPRQFDAGVALGQARDAFWRAGYQATSLDDLSVVTGLKRPSLYGAFGDKRALYLAAVKSYRETNMSAARALLTAAPTWRAGLASVLAAALAIYLRNAQGCFILGTAPSEAETDAEVRAHLRGITDDLDAAFAARVRRAQAERELPAALDPDLRGRLATAALHSLSVRARAGERRPALEALAAGATETLG